MKVHQLLKRLKQCHPEDEVLGEIEVVQPKCAICGGPATPGCWQDTSPVCDDHFDAFATDLERNCFDRY